MGLKQNVISGIDQSLIKAQLVNCILHLNQFYNSHGFLKEISLVGRDESYLTRIT